MPKKFWDLTRNWIPVACLVVRHFNHYTRMFSVLVWGYNWILIHAWVILSNSSKSPNWTKIYSFWKKTRLYHVKDCWIAQGFCLVLFSRSVWSFLQIHNICNYVGDPRVSTRDTCTHRSNLSHFMQFSAKKLPNNR